MTCSVPLEGRDELEQSQEFKLAARSSVVRHPDESLGAVSDLSKRDMQCQNTLGDSDTTHPAASSS